MEQIFKYYPNLYNNQYANLEQLSALYINWNSKINVISRKDVGNLYSHHVLHSLIISKYFSFVDGTKILDAGTGGGFPGLPLAILYPNVDFTLADSIAKKLKVIDDIAATLNLKNVTTKHIRVEDIKSNYDFVISRAVCRLDDMWSMINGLLSGSNKNSQSNGLIYLKGGNFLNEMPKNVSYKVFDIHNIYSDLDYYKDKSVVYIHK